MRIYEIKNEFQHLRLLDHGATIYEWLAFSDKTSIILNNDDLETYRDSKAGYFGSTIGRVANRIKNGVFELNGRTYTLDHNYLNKHNLHGGPNGFNTKTFDVIEHTTTKIVFKYISPDMEMGFPGELTVYVTYELFDQRMQLTFDAKTSAETIVNLTNHVHFNLGDDTILNHRLLMHADRVLSTDDECIPTGNIFDVSGTALDFQNEVNIGEQINRLKAFPIKGIDHAFLFKQSEKPIIELKFKNKKLTIETSYPGLQVYSVNRKFKQFKKGGADIPLYGGIAFECQFEPDAINHPNFSNIILKPNELYHHFILYTLDETKEDAS